MKARRTTGAAPTTAAGNITTTFSRGNMITHTPTAMPVSTDTASQRMRILAYLLAHNRMTTTEARTQLDVMHPAARIQELREMGHNIVTHWETVNTGRGNHRVASYVLLVGGTHDAISQFPAALHKR